MAGPDVQSYLDLVDWRRRVGDLYRLARSDGLDAYRSGRDQLFSTHPQSPIPTEHRHRFRGLDYFDADPSLRIAARMAPAALSEDLEIDTGGPDGVIRYRRAGQLGFVIDGRPCTLTVLSIVGYGGGLFIPFRDRTSGPETYGGGRYLADTIKNTDAGCLEVTPGSPDVVIDFNYAYNPSCAYNHLWACPLAPPENWLPVPVRAGEKSYRGPDTPEVGLIQ